MPDSQVAATKLIQYLKETKQHSRLLERRIKKIGGSGPQLVDKVFNEHEEIATSPSTRKKGGSRS